MRPTPKPLGLDIEAVLRRLGLSVIRRRSLDLLVSANRQHWGPEGGPEHPDRSGDHLMRCQPTAEIGRGSLEKEAGSHIRLAVTSQVDSEPRRTRVRSAPTVPTRAASSLLSGIRPSKSHRVRYFSAIELIETLYRGLEDNSVGPRPRNHSSH